MKKISKQLSLFIVLLFCITLLTGCHKHNFAPSTCTLPATCTKCDKTDGEPLGHSYTPATCTTPETCSRCGNTQGSALLHKWVEATCEKPKYCSVCDETEGEPLGHNYSDGNCVDDQICKNCGKKIKAPGHKWEEATCDSRKICSVCGVEKGNALGHDFENGICNRCGKDIASEKAIQEICGLKSTVETDVRSCVVNIAEDHNPYDLTYDYGDQYQFYIENCDWSLVFDVNYYVQTFPMLARLYNYNEDLLLEHFQTVGIHEGRQGNASFNVAAYYYNCSKQVYDSFGQNYEGYYFYYMLNYETEKNINTVTADNGKPIKKQLKQVLTAVQAQEFKDINQYRLEAETGAKEVIFDTEAAALANYRAYVNSKDNWDAHDWAKSNSSTLWKYIYLFSQTQKYGENNVTTHVFSTASYHGKVNSKKYYDSKEHYDCMVNPKYAVCGVSNQYLGVNNKTNTYQQSNPYEGSQFDIYLTQVSTAMHP